MYEGDSFFTLSVPGQIGLVALSLALLLLSFAVLWRSTRNRALPVRLILAVLLYAGFVWGAPQVYYQYYRLIIDGLPAQWVVGPLPRQAAELLTFRAEANLSNHAQGALGWGLLALAVLRR